MFKNLFNSFYMLLKYPLWITVAFITLWVMIALIFVAIGLFKGRRFKRGEHVKIKTSGLLKQIFYEAPKMYVDDLFNQEPDFFEYQGLVIYTGRQGHGKTISMVRDISLMQQEYPKSECITNFCYTKENDKLTDWKKLITYKNGIHGVIVGIDEIQNWFSSKQSKDFPPEMFEVVTQNRKNRRIIMATTQNFYQPAKDIRTQCTEVRKCFTILGVFTIVHAVRPTLDSQGEVKEWKHVKWYSFVHTREIRESYDTYKVIESLMKSGFKERNPPVNNNVYVVNGAKQKR